MSDHAWILENLAAYLTGGLEANERERLEQHTANCDSCAAALKDARTLDVALAGLFVEMRPSAALEDRVIQTLRNRPPDVWRLSMPTWLAIAAAALVLIGLTGAVASQFLVHGESASPKSSAAPNGSVASEFGGDVKNSDELAQSSREKMLGEIAQPHLSFFIPGDHLSVKASSTIHTRSSDLTITDGASPRAQSPKDAKGGLPSPSKPAYLGDTSGVAGSDRKNLPGSTLNQSATQPPDIFNFYMGFSRGDSTPPPTGQPQSSFQPGKMLEQNRPKDAKLHLDRAEAGKLEASVLERTEVSKRLQDKLPTSKSGVKEFAADKPPEQPGARKIVIRTGQVEYEVQSFDAAVATIARLVKPIKGGFVATVNSDKLANGKVRGSVVVRMPPEHLDELILDLRANLSKSGELKNQRLGSLDITKQYTDLESELRAARAMEERLLQIIKTGKGEIKDLLAAEKELGVWRTRIEKIEGELRYYANQVALSTLTINLFEKEITAPFGIIEREQVQMGIEVEDVDQALQAAQKAVREAKGRITRAELKQPSQGQFSALMDFEVAPEAAGPLRDRLKQLGAVARFDISRLEETQGGDGKPSDGKITRRDARFHVHFYNLTNVEPRETVYVSLACVDVEAAMKTLLARVEKAAGRVVSSNLNSTRGTQAQGELLFQVKTPLADAVLEDAKSAGEVMGLQVREITNIETTRKKRGFHVKLLALEAATARENDEIQLACAEVATSYRGVLEAVAKIKGHVRNAQLNEQDRRNVTATLDLEVRRADEAVLRAALAKAGDVYTRKVSRAADADNVVDSKVHWQMTFLNQANIPPRETYVFGVEVADVDQTAALLSASVLAGEHPGRIVESNVSRERSGRVTGKLIYDVPMAKLHELLDMLKSTGTVRVQQSAKHPEVPDSPLAIARLEVTLSNKDLIVPSDDGFVPNIRRGLADSFMVLSWTLRILILGLCVILPWVLVVWVIYRLVMRTRRRSTPTAPAA